MAMRDSFPGEGQEGVNEATGAAALNNHQGRIIHILSCLFPL